MKIFSVDSMACRGLWMEVAWLKFLLSSRGRAICCKHIPKWPDLKVTKPNDLKNKRTGGSLGIFSNHSHSDAGEDHSTWSIGWGLPNSQFRSFLLGRAFPMGRQVHKSISIGLMLSRISKLISWASILSTCKASAGCQCTSLWRRVCCTSQFLDVFEVPLVCVEWNFDRICAYLCVVKSDG